MPAMTMFHERDPREVLLEKLGDISSFKLFNNQVLIALYIRPTKTKSGIHLTDRTVEEDIYQSKVGLVVKLGPTAFQDDTNQWFNGTEVKLNDWVYARPSDGWTITINNIPCRILHDVNVRGTTENVDMIW